MLHRVRLPNITRSRLTEAMHWQFTLLRWAATAETIDLAHCQQWLEERAPLRPRARKIAAWVWDANARCTAIDTFGTDSPDDAGQKLNWLRERRKEALRLLRGPQGTLEQINYKAEATPKWKKAASKFWLEFYESLRNSSLPKCFFHSADDRFTAQDFLRAFLDENKRLCVCPVCDVTTYFTIVQRGKEHSVYTDIDHYLPKGRYPHLAIHPYNLVPLCHNCNSGTKGEEDPLSPPVGDPRRLQDIWLPYRDSGLSACLLLSIEHDSRRYSFGGFVIKREQTVRQQIDVLKEVLSRVYDLPNRWQEQIDEVGEKLFRRMRDYTRFLNIEAGSANIQSSLCELLYLLDQEDAAREPYAIAMTWWLAYLINTELSHDGNPLAQEIKAWGKRQIKRSAQMRAQGEAIRALVIPPTKT